MIANLQSRRNLFIYFQNKTADNASAASYPTLIQWRNIAKATISQRTLRINKALFVCCAVRGERGRRRRRRFFGGCGIFELSWWAMPIIAGGSSARGRYTLFSKFAQPWLLKDDWFWRFRHQTATVCNGLVCAVALMRCIPSCSQQRLGRGCYTAPFIAVEVYKHHLSQAC